MEKFITKRNAKILLLAGGSLLLITIGISLIVLWYIYGSAGSAFQATEPGHIDSSNLQMWSTLTKANMLLQAVAAVVLAAGVVMLILSYLRSRHKHA